jgi:transposase
MSKYSQEFQEKMVAKLLHPSGPTRVELAEELGVSTSSLYRWVEKFKQPSFSNNQGTEKMSKEQNKNNITIVRPQNWSAANKLQAVNETCAMTEEELGAYCRRNGIYTKHLTEWKEAIIEGLKPSANKEFKQENTKLKNEVKVLKAELTRKEKALAETSALLILKKKAHLIWGEEKDA